MARRKQNRKRADGFVFPTWVAVLIVVSLMGALGYLWVDARCRMIGMAIKDQEQALVRLDREYSTQMYHWTRETHPRNIQRALDTHGIDMSMGGERVTLTAAEVASLKPTFGNPHAGEQTVASVRRHTRNE
jgi:hypothetical protein